VDCAEIFIFRVLEYDKYFSYFMRMDYKIDIIARWKNDLDEISMIVSHFHFGMICDHFCVEVTYFPAEVAM